ncbi:MAG: DUF1307 domain-containing protein [Bacilli bacterium]|nr:DUF1307 domain-containing protein [Bacilli bacterium]
MKKMGWILLIGLLFITACEKENVQKKEVNTSNEMIHEHCTRIGTIDSNSTVDMNYELYYTGERINRIESIESVTSTDSEVLDTYENAYRTIHSYYVDIDHYDTDLVRTETNVTSTMIIDYDHINIAQLVALEGEEDNIFENNVPMISKYRELSKKMGITCEKVS